MNITGVSQQIRSIYADVTASGTGPSNGPQPFPTGEPTLKPDRFEPSGSRPKLPMVTYSRGGT